LGRLFLDIFKSFSPGIFLAILAFLFITQYISSCCFDRKYSYIARPLSTKSSPAEAQKKQGRNGT